MTTPQTASASDGLIGTDRKTGQPLQGVGRVQQAIDDILTTPLGARQLRGAYGSMLYDLLDSPLSPATLQRLRAATVDAIKKWEPEFIVGSVDVTLGTSAGAIIGVTGSYKGATTTITLSLIHI